MNYGKLFESGTLRTMAQEMPMTIAELQEMPGMTATKVNRYNAGRFLDITTKFSVMLSSRSSLY